MRLKTLRRLLLPGMTLLLTGCQAVLLAPSGDLALRQRNLIYISTALMLIIVVPVIALTLLFAWHYRASNQHAAYEPDWDHSTVLELVIWSCPLLIIIALGAVTWVSTHKLDPFRSLERLSAGRPVSADARPLEVDVVALDWKWLFLYPEQDIAVMNEVAAPVDRPIRFKVTSLSVMNSFFIPALAGQIYAMPGMETQLQAVINEPGDFQGFSANYSGAGFSGMRFTFRGLDDGAFAQWVQQAKASGAALSRDAYAQLEQPSQNDPVRRYASVVPGLWPAILTHCVHGGSACMDSMKMKTPSGAGGAEAMRSGDDAAHVPALPVNPPQ